MRGLYPEQDLMRALTRKMFGPARRRPSLGSKVHVGLSIGRPHTCWCGRPQDHDWPMKEDGAPHPRYPE